MKYTSETLHKHVLGILAADQRTAAAAESNRQKLAEMITAHAMFGFEETTVDDDILAMHVDHYLAKHRDLARAVPSADQVRSYLLKGVHDPKEQDRIRAAVETMSEGERLAAVPDGMTFVTLEPEAKKPFREMSFDELHAEIEKRWGKPAHALLPSERAKFIAALYSQDPHEPAAPIRDPHTPAEKIANHRRANPISPHAKRDQRSGKVNPLTGRREKENRA